MDSFIPDPVDSFIPDPVQQPPNTKANTFTDTLQGLGHLGGIGPVLNATYDTVMPTFLGGNKADFGTNLRVYRMADESAKQNSPYGYGAGNFIGTAAPAVATGGNISALGALGAVEGASNSNSSDDIAKNAAIGAGLNAGLGAAGQTIGKIAGNIAQTTGAKYLSSQLKTLIEDHPVGWQDTLKSMVTPLREILVKNGGNAENLGSDVDVAKEFLESLGTKAGIENAYNSSTAKAVSSGAANSLLPTMGKTLAGGATGYATGAMADLGVQGIGYMGGGEPPSIKKALTSPLAEAGAAIGGYKGSTGLGGQIATRAANAPGWLKSTASVGNTATAGTVGPTITSGLANSDSHPTDSFIPDDNRSRLQRLADELKANAGWYNEM